MSPWPISRALLHKILEDRVTDRFVAQLVWERLGYQGNDDSEEIWRVGPETPSEWSEKFPRSPEVIIERKASVHLTRSIPTQYKQILKEYLNFQGYKVTELFPRRVRRATVVNWLLYWLFSSGQKLPDKGPLPKLYEPPANPAIGHPGDPLVRH